MDILHDASAGTGVVTDLYVCAFQVPPHCIPIHANVATYNWKDLADVLQFDVIMMDPPWALATANPTRGATQMQVCCNAAAPALPMQGVSMLHLYSLMGLACQTLQVWRWATVS
jgi:hypothetical protein